MKSNSTSPVYLPQVWNKWRSWETWRLVFTALKYCKREGLHLPLVLVRLASISYCINFLTTFRFILLAVLSTLVIFYRLIIIISPKMRAYLLYIRFRLIRREVINTIVKKSYVGDWFLFYMLGQNVDSMIFKEVMHELARKLGHLGKDFSDTWTNGQAMQCLKSK